MQNDGNLVLWGPQLPVWSSEFGVASSISPDQHLYVGEELVSPSEQYRCMLQSDGNLVVYGQSGAIWSSGTTGASNPPRTTATSFFM
jgi:hypothetical protein